MTNVAKFPERPAYPEHKYADLDEETGFYCVFGEDSGFAYSSHGSMEEAVAVLPLTDSGVQEIPERF